MFQSIPDGWQRTTLRHLAQGPKNGAWGSEAGEDEIDAICVRVADFDWSRLTLNLDDPTTRSFKKQQFKNLQLRRGDIVIEKSGGGEKTPVGRVVSFDEDVEAVTSNFVARIRPHESVWNRFFLYLLSAHYMSGYSHQFIKQNTGIQNLDDTNLFRSDVWVPDLATQRQIADFLDRETARIDLLIEKKQRLVALLEEKSASEVDYLIDGTHPRFAHVNSEYSERRALKLKTLCSRLGNGFVGPTRDILVEEEYSNSVPYLQSTHVKNRQIEFERKPYFVTNAWLKEKPKARVRRDDLVIVQTGAGCGATAIVDDKFDGSGCHAMIITRPKPERILPRLLLQILCSRSGREALASIETGALHPHLEVGFVKEVSIPTPPPSVQRNLLNWIEDELAALERIQQKTIASIDRLREYRSAQITAAVTGQIDVSTYAKSGTPDRRLDAIQEEMGA
ncbi:restriction endonuclease subunit S [Seohaeicola zhoushanensis]|nr:restriction endonuclease subunit S [Seohaeicola zhoushanensis]